VNASPGDAVTPIVDQRDEGRENTESKESTRKKVLT